MDGREYLMKTVIGPLFFALIGIGIAVIVHTVSDSDEAEKAPKTTKTRHTRVAEEVPNELLPIYATEKSRFDPEPEQRVREAPVHKPTPKREAPTTPAIANDVQAFQAAVNDERTRRQDIDNAQAAALERKPDPNILAVVNAGNPEVTGNLDNRAIQKVVKQHIAQVRKCYEKELANDQELKGQLTLQWLIDEGGYVSRIGLLETDMNNNRLESCIEDAIEYWHFPKPKSGDSVHVSCPFSFETKLKSSYNKSSK